MTQLPKLGHENSQCVKSLLIANMKSHWLLPRDDSLGYLYSTNIHIAAAVRLAVDTRNSSTKLQY